ncbi:MAG: tRNA pseudouridine(38-40) synthase TruA [Campylobacteraceae bacterium]
MRVFIYLSYNGSKFCGFQQQPNKNGVMDKIIFTCKELGINSDIQGSGRTDVNVHALNQVIHLDLPLFWSDLKKLKIMLNRQLHPFLHVKKVLHVKKDFHARYSATKRLYRYICTDSHSPFLSEFAHFKKDIDIEFLNEILKEFVGNHDFGYFKKTGSPTSSDERTIYKAFAYKYRNFTIINFLGNGFLRSQIRLMMGFVFKVLDNELSLEELRAQIKKEKRVCSDLASANGLYFSRTFYEF